VEYWPTVAQASEALTIVVGYDGLDAAPRGLSRVGRLPAGATTLVVVAVTPARIGRAARDPGRQCDVAVVA
jgi:hypothetical protein